MGIILNGHGERISGISSYHGFQQLSRVSPPITGRYTLQISRFTRRGEARRGEARRGQGHPRPRNRNHCPSSSSKPESFLILVLETVAFLLASIYRGFLVRVRFHPRLVNPPRLGGNPRRGLARIFLASHVWITHSLNLRFSRIIQLVSYDSTSRCRNFNR